MRKLIFIALFLLTACTGQPTQDARYGESGERESARIHAELAAGYFAQNQLAIALEEYTLATRYDASYGAAYNGLGLVYGMLRDDVKAEANFKKSLELDAGNSESRNNYGTFLCSRNRVDESIVQFLEAVKNPLYSTPAQAYMNAGICSLRKKDVSSAELYFKSALQIEPLLHAAAYQLSLIQFNLGQYEVARNSLQYALVTAPTAEMLWLAIQIERKLGGQDAEASYALELRRKFPSSEQAKALFSGANK
ncbi:MAG: type IV pilus biogenesis/stability protein PilW [Methylophilaceae bacterium]|nr:type IV pilus biogenesis/stability protein PilW [Methylophilaceae bacterium]